jgi:hypothetical protein
MKFGKTLKPNEADWRIIRRLRADLRFDLKHGVGTKHGGDPNELLTVGFAALYFIQTAL